MTGITILNIWDDEDMVEFSIKISNGFISCELEFYQSENVFFDLANELIDFPKNIEHKIYYDDGNWNNSGYKLSFEVFCYQPDGKSVIKVFAKSDRAIPESFESTFYIFCFPASLNELGQKLKKWNPRVEKRFEWLLTHE